MAVFLYLNRILSGRVNCLDNVGAGGFSEAAAPDTGKHMAQNLRLSDFYRGLWRRSDAGAGSVPKQSEHCFVSQVSVRVADLSPRWLVCVLDVGILSPVPKMDGFFWL